MIVNIKNSNGKVTGTTEISEDGIIIDNKGKPILKITDDNILNEIKQKIISNNTLINLYNNYTMSIGEIASLYNRCYSNINKLLKTIPEIKMDHRGRRNRAYGHKVSEQQSQKMTAALKGRKATQYIRTPETKEKISKSLKKYFQEHPQDPTPHINNWKNGVYDKVDFKKGIGGHFTSLKTNQTIRFRSLLELYYLLLIEKDSTIINYQYEPFHIKMDNGRTYMPDFLINNSLLIELKPKKYVERISGVKEKVDYKKSQAIKYCTLHNLQYKIIYDEDIGFDTKRMKHYIKDNPEIIKQYNISFTDPKRMV